MASTNAVTIDGEHTRRIVTYALWRILAADVVGERELGDACFSRAWRSINPCYALDEELAEAEFRLARIGIIQVAIRTVTLADVGERVELPVAAEELKDALEDCVRAIEMNDGLLAGLSGPEQHDVEACRRSASWLLAALQERAAAISAEFAHYARPRIIQDRARAGSAGAGAGVGAGGIGMPDFAGRLTAERLDQAIPLGA